MSTLIVVTPFQAFKYLQLPGATLDSVNDAATIAAGLASGALLVSDQNGAAKAASILCQQLHRQGGAVELMTDLMMAAIADQGVNLPKGTNLGDAASSPDLTAARRFVLPAATLSASRIYTLKPPGDAALVAGLYPITQGSRREFTRLDAGAFTMTLLNGGPAAGNVFVGVASKANFCVVEWNGTDWEFVAGGAQ